MSDILKQINNPLFRTPGSRFMSQGGGITGIPNNMSVRPDNMNMSINPNLNLSLGQSSLNDIKEEDAKKVGLSILSQDNINATKDKIDDLSKDKDVDIQKDFSTDIERIMAGLTKITNASPTKVQKLYEEQLENKPTPEKSLKKVNTFFGVDANKQTPAWADAALAIGASLLKQPKAGETALQQVGTALAAGGVAAKAKKAEVAKKDLAIKQLGYQQFVRDQADYDKKAIAFENYLEKTEKSKKEGVKNLVDIFFKGKKFGLDQKKFLLEKKGYSLDEKKFNLQFKEDIADAFSAGVKVLPEKLRGKALGIIFDTKNKKFIEGINSPEQVLPTIYSLLAKENEFKFEIPDDGKNIVSKTFKITDPQTYAVYKEKFPEQFSQPYDPAKTYTIHGFVDKTATGALINNITQPTVSFTNTIKPSNIAALESEIKGLEKRILAGGITAEETDTLNEQIKSRKNAINKFGESQTQVMFLDEDGNFKYASGSAKDIAGGLDTQKNKDNIEKYNSGKNNFLRLIALSDIILSKAADPNFAKATGFYSRFGDFLLGAQNQFKAFTTDVAYAGEEYQRYKSGIVDAIIANPNGENAQENKFIRNVFTNFKEATKGNQVIQSAIMDIAYALAGSRETGKLTDKDIAMSLETIGGRSFAEKDLFTNPERLKQGIRNAVKQANIDFGLRASTYYKASRDYEKRQGNEDYELIKYDPIRLVKGTLEDIYPGISERVLINKKPGGGLEFVPDAWYKENVYNIKTQNYNDDSNNLKEGFKLGENTFKDVSTLANFVLRASTNTGEFANSPYTFQTEDGAVGGEDAIKLLITRITKNLNEEQTEQFLKQIGYQPKNQ